jgi:hypothetical protein
MIQFNYTKSPVSVDRLAVEVRQSTISVALDYISLLGAEVAIFFKSDLSESEITTLGTIVTAHTGESLPENLITTISGIVDTNPFAVPTYRTKYNATDAWISIEPSSTATNDFKLTSERYVAGGQLMVKDAAEGDYITAEVRDVDGIIPSPYRAALCEAHPTVAMYVEKWWINPSGGYTIFDLDTAPLNAKIPAGMYLRVTYYASSSGTQRKIAVNYKLTKKL